MFTKLKKLSLLACLGLLWGCGDDSQKDATPTPQENTQPSDSNPGTQEENPTENPGKPPNQNESQCTDDICATKLVVCQSDEECSDGEECVIFNGKGFCTSSDEVIHCFDKDGDGYYSASSSKYNAECGFSDTNPSDPDDNNPLVYPGAKERCDGIDNSGDGCVDSICQKNADCKKDTSYCEAIITPCWGVGDYHDYDNSVCSAEEIGVTICMDGKLVHAIIIDGKIVKDSNPEGRCPHSLEEIPNFAPEDSDGIDRNCDGIIDNP